MRSVRICVILLVFICSVNPGHSQKVKVDSLAKRLAVEQKDTARVRLMWTMARDMTRYDPDSAMKLAQQSLYLAQHIGDKEGESRSLGILANTFVKIGNYARALELNIRKLKLEEKREKPENLASVLMNIGIVYALEEDYRIALQYYSKADSVIEKFNVDRFRYNISLNIGDTYNRLNISDSAYVFFNKSFNIAKAKDDRESMGISMTGLGHCYLKLGSYEQSLMNYKGSLDYLQESNNDEVLCESTLGLANLFRKLNKPDSSERYATISMATAKKGGFLPAELEAAEFLTEHYKSTRKIDSAFAYVSYVQDLNDSVNSKSKIRETQIISSNEQFRQSEMEEERRHAQKKRFEQLQLLLIGIFIPAFFLLTLLLSRARTHTRLVRLLGVLSLLFLFEYLTLLLHPTVAKLTNHTPLLEILIFVALAAILIPLHHRLEHWLIHKLSHFHLHHQHSETKTVLAVEEKKSPA
ncbi:MAG: tetratricopeptide repeat protein [Chitinophagaceae bacterium]|nr:tetratricopeptide repeat protein [Chitinophagaceae bacterium]